MRLIHQFKFSLYPEENPKAGFVQPHGYLFRGIFMNWMQQYDPDLSAKLHKKQERGETLFGQRYALQQHWISLHPSSRNSSSRTKQQRLSKQRSRGPKGIQFVINSADPAISQGLIQHLMGQQEQIIQFGPQKAIISHIEVQQQALKHILYETNSQSELTLRFVTPTSFSKMGDTSEMRVPLPEYVFPNLARQWNFVHQDTEQAIPIEFYDWVQNNIVISSYQLKTHAWQRGKQTKFVGARGWVNYLIKNSDNELGKWPVILARYGEYMNVGQGRTAGFGRILLKSK